MRLEGVALLLVFVLTIAYGVIVDIALLARLFRYRASLIVGSIVALAVIFLFLGQTASPSERAGFFNVFSGGSGLVLLVVTGTVFLPFVVIAPFAQYLSMRDGRQWPGWITAWMALQLALLPGFIVLAVTDHYFWQRDYSAGQAEGRQAGTGGLAGLLRRAELRHERIWGTGWTYPWPQKPTQPSGWVLGLAVGIDASAPIAASEPLVEPDRAALQTLMKQYLFGLAVPNLRVKLLWDALEPGGFSRQLAPNGMGERGEVSEEVIPVLLERLEKHAGTRLCPGGRMMDADRAVLNALVLAKGRAWSVEKRAYEMRPQAAVTNALLGCRVMSVLR